MYRNKNLQYQTFFLRKITEEKKITEIKNLQKQKKVQKQKFTGAK